MIAARELVKMPNVESLILLAIQLQDAAQDRRVDLAPGRLVPLVGKPERTVALKSAAPPTQRARIEVENVGGLDSRQAAGQCPQHHLLHLHGALHHRRAVRHRHLLG